MFKIPKIQFSIMIRQIILAAFLITQFTFIPTTNAQTPAEGCQLANQYRSFLPPKYDGPANPNATPEEINKEIDEKNSQNSDLNSIILGSYTLGLKNFKNHLVIIAEEPLGPTQAGFSYNCARKITCESAYYSLSKNATKTEKCATEYTTVSDCSPDNTSDKKVSCEIIQVYISPPGTNLLYQYMGQIYRYMSIIGGLIAVLIIIFAGILWSTAGGNSESVSKAKSMITRSLVGLILLFMTGVILYTINPNFFIIS